MPTNEPQVIAICRGCGKKSRFLTPFHTQAEADSLALALSGDILAGYLSPPTLSYCCQTWHHCQVTGYEPDSSTATTQRIRGKRGVI